MVSFQYDDKRPTLNYQDEQVQNKIDVKFVEQIYDYMKRHLSQALRWMYHQVNKAK